MKLCARIKQVRKRGKIKHTVGARGDDRYFVFIYKFFSHTEFEIIFKASKCAEEKESEEVPELLPDGGSLLSEIKWEWTRGREEESEKVL